MRLRKRSSQRPQHHPVNQPQRPRDDSAMTSDGRPLPGIAGYSGIDRLPKNAIPITRFRYVRPDGEE